MTNSLGLYIHIPFCEKKCNYCSFYSSKPLGDEREKYVEKLVAEINKWGVHTARPINSIYFGGGTPSLLCESEIKAIMFAIKNSFTVLDDCEITCEVNPNSAESFLKGAVLAGVNRISVGIQSSNSNELELLGRLHSFEDAENTFKLARELGIKNISADIMLGLPRSNISTLRESIGKIIGLKPNHISAYILKIEENTPFYKSKDSFSLPCDDDIAEQYLFLCDTLKSFGYEHYEISNFALNSYESRHNNKYWNCEEYIGIGPSAHSFFEGKRFYYSNSLTEFLEGKEPVFDCLGGDWEEYIMLRLRLSKGLEFKEYKNRFNKDLDESIVERAKFLEKSGLCKVNSDRIFLTDKGMLVSNSVILNLL